MSSRRALKWESQQGRSEVGSGESERGTRNGGIDESWEGRLVLCCGSDAEAREREVDAAEICMRR